MGDEKQRTYGCTDYREEMRLMGLKRRLESRELPPAERAELEKEIRELETKMGM